MSEVKRAWSPPQIFGSAIIAIVAWTAVGFSWFGSGFDWTTQHRAMKMSEKAVTESLAAICVAQARSAPDSSEQLEKLAGMSVWTQRDFVVEAQWATMPGSEEPRGDVAEVCAAILRKS